MAVTGYFLDQHWEYREILLGFQPLSGSHTGANLSEVVLKLLQQHKITDRVLAVTTDNDSLFEESCGMYSITNEE